jgi:hypothetical protein
MRALYGLAPILAIVAVTGLIPKEKKAESTASPTYAKDIAPILNARCVTCHQPGQVAPFSLVGYDNARKWSTMVSTVASSRRMPPWKAVHGFGEFKGENRLENSEIDLINRWATAGAPRGDKRIEPKASLSPNPEWTLGKPDLILQASKPFRLGAEGEDLYRNFVVRSSSKDPLWVTALDVLPGNRKVVHHVIVYLDSSHVSDKLAAQENDGQDGYTNSGGGVGFLPSGSLGGWAPGLAPRKTPEGTAFKVEPNSNFVIQVHYHRSGKEEVDLTKVGLYLSKQAPEKVMNLHWLFNFGVNIPAGEANYKLRREYTLPHAVTVYGAMPHMHLLGRSMKAWYELPDGTKKPIVYIDDWDFNWQFMYAMKEPLRLPAGTKEIVEATYDNSAKNPRNPNNPPRRVTWGEQTTDEMFLLISSYTVD